MSMLRWGSAKLPQHGGHLAAMITGVADHVHQHLPEGRHAGLPVEQLVFDDALDPGVVQSANQRPHSPVLAPSHPQRWRLVVDLRRTGG